MYEKFERSASFRHDRFGMFIHFGLYSKLESEWKGKAYYGNAEWIMNGNQAGIPVDEYMAEASGFNPSSFDAEEIVSIAKDAGMKYIIITSKHHEGFAMFDSEVSDFDIVDATPFGRDVIGELAEACHRAGLGIGFYYSQWQDWTAPGGNGGPSVDADGKEVRVEWKKKDQYGRILGVVFTGETEVNLEMVKGGFAWHYKYFDKTPAYADAEVDARAGKRGLWSDPHPVNPHEFRKKRN